MQAIAVIEETQRAAAALQPLRLSLLDRLAEPKSATALAKEIGTTRQKLNYHLKALLEAGLVEQVEARKKGNCTELLMQATAKSFIVGPTALGRIGADPGRIQDRFSWGYLVAVCAKAIRQLGVLRQGADAAGKRLATLTVESEVRFASAEDRNAFANEIATAMAKIAAKYHQPDAKRGRTFRVFTCAHPHLPENTSEPKED